MRNKYPVVGSQVSQELVEKGLCLPSGSAMTEADLARVVAVVRGRFAGSAD